jgi:uncharacterized phiE125 gp8 family phage protein
MTPSLIQPPALEPVSLAEAKDWLRIDASDEDDLLRALIVSARLVLEAFTRRFFVTQSWRVTLDAWPSNMRDHAPQRLALPFAPFRGVAAIRVYDAARNAQTLTPGAYRAPPAPDCGRLVFIAPPPQPGVDSDGVEIDFTVGYGDRARDTPEPLRRAMTILLAHWHENRGDARSVDAMPAAVVALARPFRRERLI